MSVFQTFREILKQRLQALMWRSMASDVETDAILEEVSNLDRIEQRARQYEAEGKPHLAEMIRQRAAKIDADSPGGSVATALQRLNGSPETVPLLPSESGIGDDKKLEKTCPGLPKPRRSRRRRSESADEVRED